MQTERALYQSGELRQGSQFGQGQVVAADYSLNPMITFSQKDSRGLVARWRAGLEPAKR